MKKKLLTITDQPAGMLVEVNSTSLSVLQSCKRKAQYMLKDGYVKESLGTATNFGTGIHKALESWYTEKNDDKSIEAFKTSFNQTIFQAPDDKRSEANGEKILKAYFEEYRNDPWVIYNDGAPFIERTFEFTMHEEKGLRIVYFGTIDAAFQNTETKEICLVDHKTASTMGKPFYNRWKPNFQMAGYVFGAQQLGIKTNTMMINGILVAKTKQEFSRQFIDYDKTDFDELYASVVSNVKEYLGCCDRNTFPMAAGMQCSEYSGCQFLEVCSAKHQFKPSILKSLYGENV